MSRFEYHVLCWILQWIEIAESLVAIMLLGLWHPRWSFRFIMWMNERNI